MACNFLASRSGIDVKNSDAMSEVSESGTVTSGFNSNWSSREELRDLVTRHGLKDVADLHQDRFRIDRKKLEQMLSEDNNALIPADVFFAKIMEDTNTYITWPNKLKLGAKSKKDPHVRIAGQEEDVRAAGERIMTLLSPTSNRVTMKMDISYTDHSHIIGRGGLSIKRVMDETQCHVHFPDSNRSNALEKSNQVSISGDIQRVEHARGRVRQLIPLIFGFEPPIMSQNVDGTNPYVIKVQEQYKVQVMFKTRSKLHATIVLVKGVEWEVEQTKEATLLLMDYMCEALVNQTPVQMSIQIAPQHHQTVLGKDHSNLKFIMHYTKCQIMFPDAQDQNIPSLKKSNVNISGNIHDVYNARQMLIGSLPLLIIFDLPEDPANLKIRHEQLVEIQNECDVSINIRQKVKQVIKACIIKGIERRATDIYKARNLILGIDEPPVVCDIPRSYNIPHLDRPSSFTFNSHHEMLRNSTNQGSPLMSPLFSWHCTPSTNNLGHHAPFVGMAQNPQFSYAAVQSSSGATAGHPSFSHVVASTSSCEAMRDTKSISSISSSGSSNQPSPRKSTSPQLFKSSHDLVEPSQTSDYHSMTERKMDRLSLNSFDTTASYENKRLAGLKAMQNRPSPGVSRVPTNAWSGYGISHTSPAGLTPDANKTIRDEDIWKSPDYYMSPGVNMNTSNMLDLTPTHIVNRLTNEDWSDLPSLLAVLGLEKYVGLFVQQEVDLPTFTTLCDKDLITIGVKAFGSRRKMLLAISELNKRCNSFSAAPGAERKKCSACSPQYHNSSPKKNW